jgi:hypothetical protein
MGSAGRRPVPLPARVRITEAPIAGDHLLPAHFKALHAAILLHDAAADTAQRAPRALASLASLQIEQYRNHNDDASHGCSPCRVTITLQPKRSVLDFYNIELTRKNWLRFARLQLRVVLNGSLLVIRELLGPAAQQRGAHIDPACAVLAARVGPPQLIGPVLVTASSPTRRWVREESSFYPAQPP